MTFRRIGLTAVLGILMGLWLSHRLLARVRAVSIECERILGGDLTRRLPVTGAGDEFDSLAAAVNRVLSKLDDGIAMPVPCDVCEYVSRRVHSRQRWETCKLTERVRHAGRKGWMRIERILPAPDHR